MYIQRVGNPRRCFHWIKSLARLLHADSLLSVSGFLRLPETPSG